MAIEYRSSTVKKETLHTVSLVAPHVTPGASVLDVGCGEGYVLEELASRGAGELFGVDVVDIRRERTRPFRLFEGVELPFIDRRFDVVILSFVLHHVPDDRKCLLLREALRVCRGTLVIVEDTPVTLFDRIMNRRHGERYRRRIQSTAAYGFLTEREWKWLFRGMGLQPQARPLSRFCRSVLQPFARTAFLLRAPSPLQGV